MNTDPELGRKIEAFFGEQMGPPYDKALHTPTVKGGGSVKDGRFAIENHFTAIMQELGLDLDDDSLKNTPSRVAKMFCDEVFYGLDWTQFPACSTFNNKMKADELVAVSDIEVKSMCEHHFLPFIGTAVVGYLPGEKILGLSKFNRVVDFFSRRPQVQERLTEQIWYALSFILGTEDIGLVIKAEHQCTRLRGVKAFQSITRTSKMGGRFRRVDSLRQEFLSITNGA